MHANTASVLCLFLAFGLGSFGQQESTDTRGQRGGMNEANDVDILKSLVGEWEGTCRTWFQPGKLGDESSIRGEFKPMLGGRFVRHTYEGTMKGEPRAGEETIVFNAVENKFQVSWFDDFHMNYAIMFSEGAKAGGVEGRGHWVWTIGTMGISPRPVNSRILAAKAKREHSPSFTRW